MYVKFTIKYTANKFADIAKRNYTLKIMFKFCVVK